MPEAVRNIYDSLEAARRLRAAGLPEPHAEAVVREQVHLMEHNLATKADIEKLRLETKADITAVQADIEKLRLETKADITAVQADIEKLRLETKADITAVHADLEKLRLETRADIATVRGNIEAAKADIVKWMVGANIGVVALIVAALKLL